MNQVLLRIALALVFLGGSGGCQSSTPSEQGTEPVTVVFKHGKIAGDPQTFQSLLQRFEDAHPGILVKDETLPASTDQQHQFYVMSLEGRSAEFDVLSLDVIWVHEFARANWIHNLSHLLPPDQRVQFFPGPMEAVTMEDQVYAIPWYIDAGILYYRKDLLDKHRLQAPTTWEGLVDTAQTILAQEEDPHLKGFVWQGKQYEGLVCNILEYVWSAGGNVLDGKGRVILDSPEAEQALTFTKDLIERFAVSPPWVTTADEEATRRIFGEGRAVFMRNWPYAWNIFQKEESPIRGKVGVSVLPHFPGQSSAATLGGWQLGVNKFSRHPKEAEALVQFLTSPEVQRWMAIEIGYKPPRRALYQDQVMIATQPFITGLFEIFETARPRPVSPYYLMLSQVMQPEFSAALVGLKEPKAALKNAQRQMNHILSANLES
ncbi:MAG TPA: ABC transporter substrate-binding protein [Nitrospiria bacterium]|jgi:multiple sugar transport system substrate-binding protein